jgi:hypothetical protein
MRALMDRMGHIMHIMDGCRGGACRVDDVRAAQQHAARLPRGTTTVSSRYYASGLGLEDLDQVVDRLAASQESILLQQIVSEVFFPSSPPSPLTCDHSSPVCMPALLQRGGLRNVRCVFSLGLYSNSQSCFTH